MNVYNYSQGCVRAWVINIVGFFEVFCDVEPKRKALAAANAELAAAQEKLSKIKGKIKVDKLFIDNYFSVCRTCMYNT